MKLKISNETSNRFELNESQLFDGHSTDENRSASLSITVGDSHRSPSIISKLETLIETLQWRLFSRECPPMELIAGSKPVRILENLDRTSIQMRFVLRNKRACWSRKGF